MCVGGGGGGGEEKGGGGGPGGRSISLGFYQAFAWTLAVPVNSRLHLIDGGD